MTKETRIPVDWYDRLAKSPAIFDACITQVLWDVRRRRNQGEEAISQKILYPLMRKGGLHGGIVTVWSAIKRMQPLALHDALRNLGMILEDLEKSEATFRIVETARDLDAAEEKNQIALVLGLQGLPHLEHELYYIGMLKRLGIRAVQVTYNDKCEVGDGCDERGIGGLSKFGIKVIQELNRRRMVVDLSHVGEQTFFDVLEVSTSPVIVSHSNARAVCDHFRCVSDTQLRAVKAKGGVVGINCFAPHVAPKDPTLTHFLDHVDHIAKVIGIENVGIGLDQIYYTGSVEKYPDLYIPAGEEIKGLEDVTRLPAIAEGLEKRGFTENEIVGVLGGNFLRVVRRIIDQ